MKFLLAILFFMIQASFARASVTLLDKDEWKILMNGFVELDVFHDTARSSVEAIGNGPIDRSGTYAGDNGRTQYSIRNSRLAFAILPPEQNEWKTKGYFEFDLLGYDPAPEKSANTEGSFNGSPTMRVRHAYMNGEKNGFVVLAGQTWSLFGWQPIYVPTMASVSPGTGTAYMRTAQVAFLKNMPVGDASKLQAAVSLERPAQRDSEVPNVDGGIRFAWAGRHSGFSAASSDVTSEPLSVALSGTMRKFKTAGDSGNSGDTHESAGSAIAFDTLIPLIASDEGVGQTLTLTAEYTTGQGYADEFSGWSGNLSQTPVVGAAQLEQLNSNVDPGQGGFNSAGSFALIKMQTMNAQLQYHFDSDHHCFSTLGYGEIKSSNVGDFVPVASGKIAYEKTSMIFINLFHDYTKQIRVGAEYAKLETHYVNEDLGRSDRYQLTGLFRF